jgi:hypothetical protein
LGQGLANALGLQTGSSSESFSNIVKRLDEPRRKDRDKWLTTIQQQYPPGTSLKDILNQQEKIQDYLYPLLKEDCQSTDPSDYMNIEEDYNIFEQAQAETCKAIHDNKTAVNMDCQTINLTFKSPPSAPPAPPPKPTVLGYVRTHIYSSKNPSTPSLRLYELNWYMSTHGIKSWYFRYDTSVARWLLKHRWLYKAREWLNTRWWLNSQIKSTVVNNRIADAVLYLGVYRPLIQYIVLQGFCKLISDEKDAQREEFDCLSDVKNIPPEDEFSKENDLAIITHSLGTRIVFDILGGLGDKNFFTTFKSDLEEKNGVISLKSDSEILEHTNRLKDVFAHSLSKLFVLANQVPLLEMGEVKNPSDVGPCSKSDVDPCSKRDLGHGFQQFLKLHQQHAVSSPLQVMTFTDTNDLLSYDLKCWYNLHILRRKDHVESEANMYDDEYKAEYRKKTGKDVETGVGKRMYYENVFTCPPPTDEKWGKKYTALWEIEKKSINLVDVSVSLSGINLRPVFADPRSAHSRYFSKNENAVHDLIACGSHGLDYGVHYFLLLLKRLWEGARIPVVCPG